MTPPPDPTAGLGSGLGFPHEKPVIGVLHLPPLPGSPRYAATGGADRDDAMTTIRDRALADATALAEGGVSAIIIENFGDAPFHRGPVPPVTIAAMTRIASDVRRAVDTPIGINVLRNDAAAAVGIAVAVGARFIRVNVHVGAMLTDQGILQGDAAETLRLRHALGADVAIWADVAVKHAAPLAKRPIGEEAKDAVHRGLADAVIVTGAMTGASVDIERLRSVREAVPDTPVLIGSGATPENVSTLLTLADGMIVGTTLKRGGEVHAPVDIDAVRRLVGTVAPLRG